jgi:hypothetical protein
MKRKAGRPPEGIAEDGSPALVSKYPKTMIYMKPLVRAKVKALSSVAGEPTWKIVNDALELYFKSLAKADRLVLEMVERRQGQKQE